MKSTKVSLDESLKEAINETKIVSKIIESSGSCLLCFENNPFVLEGHHLGGKKNSSVTIPLCANCHILASKHQLSYDPMWLKPNKPDAIKSLFVLKDLHFLQDRIIQRVINELNTN